MSTGEPSRWLKNCLCRTNVVSPMPFLLLTLLGVRVLWARKLFITMGMAKRTS